MQGGLRIWRRKPMIWSWVESSGLHQGPADPWVRPPLRWALSPSSFAWWSCKFCVAFLWGAFPPHLFLWLYKISRQNMAQIKRELCWIGIRGAQTLLYFFTWYVLWYTVHSVVYMCDLILARIWLLGLCPFINRVLQNNKKIKIKSGASSTSHFLFE